VTWEFPDLAAAPEVKAPLKGGYARSFAITKTTGLTARSAAECCEQVELAGLAARSFTNVTVYGPASTPLAVR
jgi:hypothetical protein